MASRRRVAPLLKWSLLLCFGVVFFAAYFATLHVNVLAVQTMPVTRVDRWIGFQPWSLGIYLSLWFYIVCAPRLAADTTELKTYFATASALAIVGLLIFVIWPTRTPDQGIAIAAHPAFAWLHGADHGYNACPSLHAAFAVFTTAWLNRIIAACRGPRLIRLINALWGLAIVYSTVATNQHVAIDAAAGCLLGAGAYWVERGISRLCTYRHAEKQDTRRSARCFRAADNVYR